MKKISVIAAANNTYFLDDIIKNLPVQNIGTNFHDVEVIWLEWADGDCLYVLQNDFFLKKYLKKKKVILRIHRYELFNNKIIEEISKINHEVIDHLLFVCPFVKQIGVSYFPWMERGVVLPNLLDTDKFPFHDRENGFNLLFLGRISYVKNLPMMLSYFHELIKYNDRYNLHLVGDIHEKELIYYLDNFLDKSDLHGKVTIHGRVEKDKLPDLMKEMHYICSTSIFESTGMGILEGMATGLKPAIFSFPGAEYLYPNEFLFFTNEEFINWITGYDFPPRLCREFVLQNYSVKRKIGLYEDLINS